MEMIFETEEKHCIEIEGKYYVFGRPAGKLSAPLMLLAETCNLIVDWGFHMVGYSLVDESDQYNIGITYQLISTADTPPSETNQVSDVSESARKFITKRWYTEATKKMSFRTFFNASECSYNIKSVALVGTSTATSSSGTGKLFNHALLSSPVDNTSGNFDLTFLAEITQKRGT